MKRRSFLKTLAAIALPTSGLAAFLSKPPPQQPACEFNSQVEALDGPDVYEAGIFEARPEEGAVSELEHPTYLVARNLGNEPIFIGKLGQHLELKPGTSVALGWVGGPVYARTRAGSALMEYLVTSQ
jgi:hypothetical protein